MDKSDAAQDELQQAINNITNGASGAVGGGATDVAAAIESQLAGNAAAAGALPVPEFPAPEAPKIDEPQIEIAAAPLDAQAAAPAPTKAIYGDPDLDKVRSNALSDIRPVLEKIEISPEKKFIVYRDIIDVFDDKACFEPAYAAATKIADDKERAEALLYIIEKIDALGIQMPTAQ